MVNWRGGAAHNVTAQRHNLDSPIVGSFLHGAAQKLVGVAFRQLVV